MYAPSWAMAAATLGGAIGALRSPFRAHRWSRDVPSREASLEGVRVVSPVGSRWILAPGAAVLALGVIPAAAALAWGVGALAALDTGRAPRLELETRWAALVWYPCAAIGVYRRLCVAYCTALWVWPDRLELVGHGHRQALRLEQLATIRRTSADPNVACIVLTTADGASMSVRIGVGQVAAALSGAQLAVARAMSARLDDGQEIELRNPRSGDVAAGILGVVVLPAAIALIGWAGVRVGAYTAAGIVGIAAMALGMMALSLVPWWRGRGGGLVADAYWVRSRRYPSLRLPWASVHPIDHGAEIHLSGGPPHLWVSTRVPNALALPQLAELRRAGAATSGART